MNKRASFLLKTIGAAIKENRERKGMTQEELAASVNMTVEELKDLENGIVKNITREDVDTFLELMGSPAK